MSKFQWFMVVFTTALVLVGLYHYVRRRRYQRALASPFPPAWVADLKHLPIYDRLPAVLQDELRQKIKAFLYNKRFVGCEGLEITDEIRVVIAAEACLLLLNRPTTGFQKLRWIYVFPSTFKNRQSQTDDHGVVSMPTGTLLGVSWNNGRVVLAWDSVKHGVADFEDGYNVVLHEFAHQLDQENSGSNGVPLLYNQASYRIWTRVFSQEFAQLQAQVAEGSDSLIDSYGATDPAEFFAVVTELFYERPQALHSRHPELFATLHDYFQLDPRAWQESRSAGEKLSEPSGRFEA